MESTTLYSACTSIETIIRDAQFDEQGVDGHGAHDVFLRSRGGCLLCFHDYSLLTNFLYA